MSLTAPRVTTEAMQALRPLHTEHECFAVLNITLPDGWLAFLCCLADMQRLLTVLPLPSLLPLPLP